MAKTKVYSPFNVEGLDTKSGLTYTSITYSAQYDYSQLSPRSQYYLKAVSTLNSYWQKMVLTHMGKDADIDCARVFVIL